MEALCRAFPRGQNLQPISSSDHFPARNRLQPQSVRIQASSGRISVFGQMGAGAGEGQMPALVVPEGVQTQSCFVPSRTPELPRALEPSLRLRAARLRRPTAPPLLALSRPPKVHPPSVLRWIMPPLGPPFPARSCFPPARKPGAPPSIRRHCIPLKARLLRWPICHSGGKPPQSMRCRDSPRRLRLREAFGVRPLAGAVGPPHCARRPTTPPLPSTSDQMGCSPDYIAHLRAGFHPGLMVTIQLEGPVLAGLRDARKASLHRTPWNASLHVRPAP